MYKDDWLTGHRRCCDQKKSEFHDLYYQPIHNLLKRKRVCYRYRRVEFQATSRSNLRSVTPNEASLPSQSYTSAWADVDIVAQYSYKTESSVVWFDLDNTRTTRNVADMTADKEIIEVW